MMRSISLLLVVVMVCCGRPTTASVMTTTTTTTRRLTGSLPEDLAQHHPQPESKGNDGVTRGASLASLSSTLPVPEGVQQQQQQQQAEEASQSPEDPTRQGAFSLGNIGDGIIAEEENKVEEEAAIEVPAPTTPPPTFAPTVPVESIKLPATLDMADCRRHVQQADVDGNEILTQDEYATFARGVAEEKTTAKIDWGDNRFRSLPQGLRELYATLRRKGRSEEESGVAVTGHNHHKLESVDVTNTNQPTLAQELFFIKVCVQTDIAVHQILEQHKLVVAAAPAGDGTNTDLIDTAHQRISIPQPPQVVTVYSSFSLKNTVGITTANLLSPASSHNRRALDLAYQTLVTQVVGLKLGVALSAPVARSYPTGERQRRRRRRLMTVLDQQLPELYRIDTVPCDDDNAVVNPELQTEWCQIAYGKFILYLVAAEQNTNQVIREYSDAVQSATAQGELQTILREVAPDAEVVVTEAGPTLLPPPVTSESAPLENNNNEASPPNIPVIETDTPDRETKLGLIAMLGGTFFVLFCCIASLSLCMCHRNNQSSKYLHGDDDGLEHDDEDYYQREHKRKSLRQRRSYRDNIDDEEYSEYSEDMTSSHFFNDNDDPSSSQHYPTEQLDARHREQILHRHQQQQQQQQQSNSDASISSSPPTREEIAATLSAAGEMA